MDKKLHKLRIQSILILIFILISLEIGAALIWKDDFSDELIFELTWDEEKTSGTPHLKNKCCILDIKSGSTQKSESIRTLPFRALPSNFDLLCAVEFTNVEQSTGEFYIKIGDKQELAIRFSRGEKESSKEKNDSANEISVLASTGKQIKQSNGSKAVFNHNISNGERLYITWNSNGESPALQMIKVGTNPGDSNIADFIIETQKPLSGSVEIGIRDGLREIRLNNVQAYIFGTSSSLVHDWVLF
jgi:hypothetical protein